MQIHAHAHAHAQHVHTCVCPVFKLLRIEQISAALAVEGSGSSGETPDAALSETMLTGGQGFSPLTNIVVTRKGISINA